MKAKIILLLICILILSGCNNLTYSEAKQWQDLGYMQGYSKGLDVCDKQRKEIFEQFTPPEDCFIVNMDENIYKFICKEYNLELYNLINEV